MLPGYEISFTRDPDVRYSQGDSATAIARYSIAVDRPTTRNAGDNQPTADFINCVAFGKNGEFAESKNSESNFSAGSAPSNDSGFYNMPDGIDDDIPFA